MTKEQERAPEAAVAWLQFISRPDRAEAMAELRVLKPNLYELVRGAFKEGYWTGYGEGAENGIRTMQEKLIAAIGANNE